MLNNTNKAPFKVILLFCIAICIPISSYAQKQKTKRFRSRLSLAPVKSKFKNDVNLTNDSKSKTGFTSSYELEYYFMVRSSFIIGVQHMYQRVIFQGYFNAPNHTFLYDETFPYMHDLRIQEMLFPLTIKYTFLDEKTFEVTPYIKAGVGVRTIIKTYTVIINDSTIVTMLDSDKRTATYENESPTNEVNTYITTSFGIQKNFKRRQRAIFLELGYKYGISRFHYTGLKDSNNLLISNSSIAFIFGVSL